MTGFSKHKRLFARCLWAFLALVCILFVFLPHMHECEGMECAICALGTLFWKLLLPAVAATVLCCAAGILNCRYFLVLAQPHISLVQLKVKLSD